MTGRTTTSDSDSLEVHVIGRGKGESVVLKLPHPDGPKWGVVDCYGTRESHPTIDLLSSRGVTADNLEFVCLTHPHDDHFLGMHRLLEEFRPRFFWYFDGVNLQRFRKKLVDVFGGDPRNESTSAKELKDIFEFVSETSQASPKRYYRKRVVILKDLYPNPYSGSSPVRIRGLGPPDQQLETYELELERCLEKFKAGKWPKPRHNMISAGLLIEYEKTRIVLGGDMESAAWQEVLANFECEQLSAHVVKVSHHGSGNALAEGLWDCLTAGPEPSVAVVAPFRRFRLPKQSTLDEIRRAGATPVLTCQCPHLSDSQDALDDELLVESTSRNRSENVLREALKIVGEPLTSEAAVCSFVYDANGRLLKSVPPLPGAN